MDPRLLSDAELAAARLSPQQLIAAPGFGILHPANLFRDGQGGGVDVNIPGVGPVTIPTPELPSIPNPVDVAGGVVSDVGGAIGQAIAGAVGQFASVVLGPIAEISLTVVIAGAGLGLVVWAVIALARRSPPGQAAEQAVTTVAPVASRGAAR